ncbi:late secretory pathway protein AVL9 homolog isoform X2 [Dermacentor andersoni]|uniref:late secretory pathway protein AVL9 homolog isoform X2 n=1 Tax=Dermacentor andersoni TaxID=34620 RepID=UPI0024165A77|nr:late secretory pathway protein AVL9 homolog isoform X2 [Dermacentor andersoni]
MEKPPVNEAPILHVIVVGFHHIKGYQLEYAYPPILGKEETEAQENQDLPEPWKHLPSLALPDGAHNYEEDTVYFHLPALDNPKRTVFGISCYRQINAEMLLRRGSDVTRSSVQKSVCVLSRLPLYGVIQAKLQLVTHAYFEERDFSQVALLKETYQNLNALLSSDMMHGGQPYLGLSSRDLILHFKHKAVLLFKLLLLERKVLFYKTPVKDLCSTILTLCSLFPGMLEQGLEECACTAGLRQLSSELHPEEHDFLEVHLSHSPSELKQSLDTLASEKNREKDSSSEGPMREEQVHSPEDLSLLSKTIRNSESKCLAKRAESFENATDDVKPLPVSQKDSDEKKEKTEAPRLSLGSVGKELISKILPVSLGDIPYLNRVTDDAVFEEEDKLVSEIDELLDSDPKEKTEMRSKLEFVEREDCDMMKSPTTPVATKETASFLGNRGFNWSKLPSAIYSLTSRSSKMPFMGSLRLQEDKLGGAASVRFGIPCLAPLNEKIECHPPFLESPSGVTKGGAPGAGDDSDFASEFDGSTTPCEDGSGLVTLNLASEGGELGSVSDLTSRDLDDLLLLQSIPKVIALPNQDCGMPLCIFSKGSLCLPYVSLPTIDLLSDISIRSCVVGATNDLFKQKKHLFDVIVEVDECKITILDSDLRRQLYLTMEDLRFADYLVKNVLDDTRDLFLDGTCWQGGEEWLRSEFKVYLVSLLKTAQLEDAVSGKGQEAFNTAFLSAWKTTHNFKMWNSVKHPCLVDIPSGHYYKGQLTVADMKLRISHSIQSSERGRKLNQAVVSTGRAMAQTTGKVVGGALTSAKSVVSSLWSHFSPPTPSSSTESVPPTLPKEESVETVSSPKE